MEEHAHHGLAQVRDVTQAQAELVRPAPAGTQAPRGLELRHQRAGTFTRAAERLFIAQPTLCQQIGRLEQILGTPLLVHGRGGVALTAAGTVLLESARDVLARVDHGVSRARQAAGLGRPRLRVVVPADLPDCPAVQTASRLRAAADSAGVAITWLDTPLDPEFSPVREHRADAALGWLTAGPGTLPAPLDAMRLGQFEPEVWIPRSHPAARRGVIGLEAHPERARLLRQQPGVSRQRVHSGVRRAAAARRPTGVPPDLRAARVAAAHRALRPARRVRRPEPGCPR